MADHPQTPPSARKLRKQWDIKVDTPDMESAQTLLNSPPREPVRTTDELKDEWNKIVQDARLQIANDEKETAEFVIKKQTKEAWTPSRKPPEENTSASILSTSGIAGNAPTATTISPPPHDAGYSPKVNALALNTSDRPLVHAGEALSKSFERSMDNSNLDASYTSDQKKAIAEKQNDSLNALRNLIKNFDDTTVLNESVSGLGAVVKDMSIQEETQLPSLHKTPAGTPQVSSSDPSATAAINLSMNDYNNQVGKLQEKYRAQLAQSVDSASRMMADKASTIAQLERKLYEEQEAHRRTESTLNDKITDLRRQVSERLGAAHLSETELLKHRDNLMKERSELTMKHEKEVRSLRDEHFKELSRLRQWTQEQIATVEANRDQLVESMYKQQKEADAIATSKMNEMSNRHVKQIEEIKNNHKLAMERVTADREKLSAAQISTSNDVVLLESKVQNLELQLAQAEEKHKEKLANQRADFDARERNNNQLIASIRSEKDLQEEQYEAQLKTKDERIKKLSESFEKLHSLQEDHVRVAAKDIEFLNKSLEQGRETSEQQEKQNKQLMQLVKSLQKENKLLKQEIELQELNHARHKNENVLFKKEIERLEKFVYGKRRTNISTGPIPRPPGPPKKDVTSLNMSSGPSSRKRSSSAKPAKTRKPKL